MKKHQGADISSFKDKAVGRYETFGENTGWRSEEQHPGCHKK